MPPGNDKEMQIQKALRELKKQELELEKTSLPRFYQMDFLDEFVAFLHPFGL